MHCCNGSLHCSSVSFRGKKQASVGHCLEILRQIAGRCSTVTKDGLAESIRCGKIFGSEARSAAVSAQSGTLQQIPRSRSSTAGGGRCAGGFCSRRSKRWSARPSPSLLPPIRLQDPLADPDRLDFSTLSHRAGPHLRPATRLSTLHIFPAGVSLPWVGTRDL